MKRKRFMGLTLLFCASALVATVFAMQPGTDGDPLVSKSYVDGKINELAARFSAGGAVSAPGTAEPALKEEITSDVLKTVEPLIALLIEQNAAKQQGDRFEPVFVSAGQTVIGGEGTEMILRSGKGYAYIAGAAGLVDATLGSELTNNRDVVKDHILLVPRDDGRGVRVTEDAWFMVKGTYEIR